MSLTEEQIQQRRFGITGTDAPAIVGLSQWKTASEVWLEKKHPNIRTEPTEKVRERLEWGNRVEHAIACYYAEKNNCEIYKPGTIIHPKVPWLLGNPDYLIQNERRGLEVKNVHFFQSKSWGASGTDQVPQDYLIQCQHYMMVTGCPSWTVAACIGGSEHRYYNLYADKELMCLLFTAEKKFYDNYIIGDKQPVLETGELIRRYVLAKYPQDTGREITLDPYGQDDDIKEALLQMSEAQSFEKKYKKIKEEKRAKIMLFMEDASALSWPEKKIYVTFKKTQAKMAINFQKISEEALASSRLTPEEVQALKKKYTTPKKANRKFQLKVGDADMDDEDDE